MADEKHESKRSCYSRHKWLPAAAAILLLVFLAAGFSFRYISFASQTIYQESTSHLEGCCIKPIKKLCWERDGEGKPDPSALCNAF